jgi:hypothetical protein
VATQVIGAAGTGGIAPAVGEIEREMITTQIGAGKTGTAKVGIAKAGAAKAVGIGNVSPVVAKVAASPMVSGAASKAAVGGAKGATSMVTGGGFLGAKGLGLGLGLGIWGPVALGVAGAGAVYLYLKSRAIETAQSDIEVELSEALA